MTHKFRGYTLILHLHSNGRLCWQIFCTKTNYWHHF